MIEVFKTNVKDHDYAGMLIGRIHKNFIHYKANFDLHDCDNILRVKCVSQEINCNELIAYLEQFGCKIEALTDEVTFMDKRISIC